jgi:L-threonylcarbamoyladenylate synthase
MENNTREAAVTALKAGKTILYPTDTVWGIGCDATNEEACQQIVELKQRPAGKSFIVLVDSVQMLEKYIPEFPEVCYDLIDLAETPLTIIYPNARGLAPTVLAEDGSVGIRVTKDPLCVQLIRAMRQPLVSTSANLSGQPVPKSFAEIDPQLTTGVAVVVEEKTQEIRSTPSQIIQIGLNSSIKIIRK